MWRAAARSRLFAKNTSIHQLGLSPTTTAALAAPCTSFRSAPGPLLQCILTRSFATTRPRRSRYKTPRSKLKGPRRLIPRPSLHRKPPTFKYRSPKDKLTPAEVQHEKFKQVLSRLQIRQLAWRTDDVTSGHTKNDYGKDENKCLMRRASGRVDPFAKIPTFRRKEDCGPPPISMKKKKGAVTISRITFGDDTKGVGKIGSFKQQMKKLKKSRWSTNLRLANYNGKRTMPAASYQFQRLRGDLQWTF